MSVAPSLSALSTDFELPPVFALVLAGGAGTRFWPASRSSRPKQLLPLVGTEALLVTTIRRVLPLCQSSRDRTGWSRVLLSTGRNLAEATRAIASGILPENLLIEPVARNTAPCIGWAAARLAERDPSAVLIVLPSDHHIANLEGFQAALTRAVAIAAEGTITTIGITPSRAETGYGYIQLGDKTFAVAHETVAPAPVARNVQRFVEKPSAEHAARFVAEGTYLWNSGMFFFRVGDILDAIRVHLPAMAHGLDAIARASRLGAAAEAEAVASVFPTLPSISIDHGVMEHLTHMAVVQGEFGWSDVGSWQSAWELSKRDPQGNASIGNTVFVDARNNHVVDLKTTKNKRVTAVVGVNDLVVVETDDALLVVPRDRAQDVRAAVEALKSRGDDDLT